MKVSGKAGSSSPRFSLSSSYSMVRFLSVTASMEELGSSWGEGEEGEEGEEGRR